MRRRLTTGVALCTLTLLAALAPPAAADGGPAWTQRALALQYELGSDLPLRNTPWVYTHNSYNSVAEMGPTLSNQDPNHGLDIVTQLDLGVRSLEIDAHLFPSPRDPRVGPLGPVVCHAQEPGAGCSGEKPLVTVLGEIRGWLDKHPRQVILLYLESHLRDEQGYAAGADSVQEALGGLMYRPPSEGRRCDPMPLELTRDDVRAAGKQVVAIGPCGEGPRWPSFVFDESARKTGSDNAPFEDFPKCGPDYERGEYDASPIRYYEDATQLTRNAGGGSDPITPDLVAKMTRCGVDLIGLDFLRVGDPRLDSFVWSWAEGQPSAAGPCSIQRADGRWEARPCRERHRVACRDATGAWVVPEGRARAVSAPRVCATPGLVNAVPRTGYEGQLLRAAMASAGARGVWLAQRLTESGWEPAEVAGCGPTLGRPERRWPVRAGVARVVVELGFSCTGQRLARRVKVSGGLRTARSRSGRPVRVRVGRGTRRLRVSYRFRGTRRSAKILLRR